MRASDTQSDNCSIGVGKNNIPWLNMFHVFIGEMLIAILLTFWGPHVTFANFMAISPFLIDPPEIHHRSTYQLL
jgi:hypothetical protein